MTPAERALLIAVAKAVKEQLAPKSGFLGDSIKTQEAKAALKAETYHAICDALDDITAEDEKPS